MLFGAPAGPTRHFDDHRSVQAYGGGIDARRLTLIATSLGFAVIQLDVNVAIKPIGQALPAASGGLQRVVDA
jgi:hypothetical protein